MTSDGSMGEMENQFLSVLAREFSEKEFDACFCDMTLAQASDELVTFETGSEQRRDLIGRHHLVKMKTLWCRAIGPVDRVAIKLRPDVSRTLRQSSARAEKKTAATPFFKDVADAAKSGLAGNSDEAYTNGVNGQDGASNKAATPLAFNDLLSPVDERNTFENFATDPSNELAFAAARSSVTGGGFGEVIYIHGASGVGKTHLLHAIALAYRDQRPGSFAA